jgi:hypothetical protein
MENAKTPSADNNPSEILAMHNATLKQANESPKKPNIDNVKKETAAMLA